MHFFEMVHERGREGEAEEPQLADKSLKANPEKSASLYLPGKALFLSPGLTSPTTGQETSYCRIRSLPGSCREPRVLEKLQDGAKPESSFANAAAQ